MKVINKVEVDGNLRYEIELYKLSLNLTELILELGYQQTGYTELKRYYRTTPTGFLYKKNDNFYKIKSDKEKIHSGIIIVDFSVVSEEEMENYIFKHNVKGLKTL